jgi:hypothetical protein
MHCITEAVATIAPNHIAPDHHDGATKRHAHEAAADDHDHLGHNHFGKTDDSSDSKPPIACCGLFSITAMAADERVQFGIAARVMTLMPALAERRDGEGPGHITKPPKA